MNANEIIVLGVIAFVFVSAFQMWRNKCSEYIQKQTRNKVSKPKAYWPKDFHTN